MKLCFVFSSKAKIIEIADIWKLIRCGELARVNHIKTIKNDYWSTKGDQKQ